MADIMRQPSRMRDLKQAVGELFDLAGEAEKAIMQAPFIKKYFMAREMMTSTLFQFFMYLSASDGFYARKEAQAIEETLGIHYTPGQMSQYVRENNIYSTTFDEKAPEILDIFVQLDNGLKQNGYVQGKGYGERLVVLMEEAGELFLQIDGSMNDDEVRDLGTYISTMQRYLDENLEKEKQIEQQDGHY